MVLAAGVAPALATFSTSCLCVGLREQMVWGLQPVMLRQDFFTKEIRRLLHGGKWSQSRVLPSAGLAYDACLNAGSIANGALTRNCTRLIRLPSECIADNALRAK